MGSAADGPATTRGGVHERGAERREAGLVPVKIGHHLVDDAVAGTIRNQPIVDPPHSTRQVTQEEIYMAERTPEYGVLLYVRWDPNVITHFSRVLPWRSSKPSSGSRRRTCLYGAAPRLATAPIGCR